MTRRAKNNPKPTINDTCMVCGAPYAATHECIYGLGNRQKSIEDGLQVKLCNYHHQQWSESPHRKPYSSDIKTPNAWFDKQLKQDAQRKYELTHTRAEFIRRYGKSWL